MKDSEKFDFIKIYTGVEKGGGGPCPPPSNKEVGDRVCPPPPNMTVVGQLILGTFPWGPELSYVMPCATREDLGVC